MNLLFIFFNRMAMSPPIFVPFEMATGLPANPLLIKLRRNRLQKEGWK